MQHLAEFNFSRAIAPMDDPRMASFVAESDRINALAEAAPGFVWRYNPPGEKSFALKAFEDPLIYVTLSVWESVEALKNFVFKTAHTPIMNRKAEWFLPLEPHLVMWWIEKGDRPTLAEARAKLEHLKQHGPTPVAFDFTRPRLLGPRRTNGKPGPQVP